MDTIAIFLHFNLYGSETRDKTDIFAHFNLYCAEATMFLGEVTVRPLLVASLLFGNYHAWVGVTSNQR